MKENHRRCCGIDVHKNSDTVCVLATVGQPDMGTKKRKFRTFTRDFKQMRAWLKNCRVTEIAMESTGPIGGRCGTCRNIKVSSVATDLLEFRDGRC